MNKKETRTAILYLLGILVFITLIFFGIVEFNRRGFYVLEKTVSITYENPPETVIQENKDYQAIIKTNKGDLKYDLLEENAPVTVNNFVFLARDRFYDGVLFHRVVKDFVLQAGSRLSLDDNPQNDGVGGPGYKFADEINWDSLGLSEDQQEALKAEGYSSQENIKSVKMGKYTLAMANAGPNTNGSQFFIVTGEEDSENIKNLQGKHTVFGTIISGQEIIDEMNNVEVDDPNTASPKPIDDLVIESIEILELEQ